MRYRVLEAQVDGKWSPVTTVFEFESQVYVFTPCRSPFHVLPGLHRVDDVRIQDIPRTRGAGEFRLSDVREVQFREHEMQRSVNISSEFIVENHIDLILDRIPHVMS